MGDEHILRDQVRALQRENNRLIELTSVAPYDEMAVALETIRRLEEENNNLERSLEAARHKIDQLQQYKWMYDELAE